MLDDFKIKISKEIKLNAEMFHSSILRKCSFKMLSTLLGYFASFKKTFRQNFQPTSCNDEYQQPQLKNSDDKVGYLYLELIFLLGIKKIC